MLSPRMRGKIHSSGCVGARIAWVRLRGPVCPIFFVAVYIPHKYRDKAPLAKDTLLQLDELLKTVAKTDCIVISGDFNCELRRNIPGLTGKWSMTRCNEKQGHDQSLQSLMHQHDLFAADTKFRPEVSSWDGRRRVCNATYIPKHQGARPKKLDYFLVSNRWVSSVTRASVKWSSSRFRFGIKFDHALLAITWKWKVRAPNRQEKPDFRAMTEERWVEFDDTLKKILIRDLQPVHMDVDPCSKASMFDQYGHLAASIEETIDRVVPKTKRQKFLGRASSPTTQALRAERIRDFSSGRKIEKSDRAAWNKVLAKAGKRDYESWVQGWVKTIEQADELGDSRGIYRGVRALAGVTRNSSRKQPTKNANGKMIQSAEELVELWRGFLQGKFAPTELEKAEREFEDIPIKQDELNVLTQEEFIDALFDMKLNKANGPDNVPVVAWQRSEVARAELFNYLQQIWQHEQIPQNFVLGVFCMIHKKGSTSDCANYRPIGLLNHSYKVLGKCLLKRLMKECGWSLSDWQAGFRGGRGCRDNVLLLRVIYDNVILHKKDCVVTFIDFAGAFDSVSHKFLDKALRKAGASRKSRALFRAIYEAATGTARVLGLDGNNSYSHTFDIDRGVIQGDIMSPIFFIIALDQILREHDTSGEGIKVGNIAK